MKERVFEKPFQWTIMRNVSSIMVPWENRKLLSLPEIRDKMAVMYANYVIKLQ